MRLLLLVQPKWGARDTTISDVSSNTEVLIASGADGMGLDTDLYNCESDTCTPIDVMQESTVEGVQVQYKLIASRLFMKMWRKQKQHKRRAMACAR